MGAASAVKGKIQSTTMKAKPLVKSGASWAGSKAGGKLKAGFKSHHENKTFSSSTYAGQGRGPNQGSWTNAGQGPGPNQGNRVAVMKGTGEYKVGGLTFQTNNLKNAKTKLQIAKAYASGNKVEGATFKDKQATLKTRKAEDKAYKDAQKATPEGRAALKAEKKAKLKAIGTSIDTKKHDAVQDLTRKNAYLTQSTQAMQSINEGVFGMMKADLKLEEGEAQYLSQMFNSMASIAQDAKNSAREAKKEASDQLTGLVQGMQQLIQAMQAFAIKPKG